MNKKWNCDAFYRLLRFGRKNEGGWTDIDIDWKDGETIPDDNDIELLMAAPTLLDALESLVMAIELPGDHCEFEQAMRQVRAALKAAKGGERGE